MAIPASRSDFAEYCLRKLGKPVIEINVDWDQVQDRIDEALIYYNDFHTDGSEKQYYVYQIQPEDITNRYITMPENMIGAIRIFPLGDSLATNNLFNIRYQISLNDLYDLTSTTMVPYYMAMQSIQFMEQLLVGLQPIRFNRNNNILYIDAAWDVVAEGQYLVVEAYQVIDPDVYTNAWSDSWLIRYTTALIKEQWGSNLIKYKDLNLTGAQKFNGEKIYNDAREEVRILQEEMRTTWSTPPDFFMG
jgi:hypothetical protein